MGFKVVNKLSTKTPIAHVPYEKMDFRYVANHYDVHLYGLCYYGSGYDFVTGKGKKELCAFVTTGGEPIGKIIGVAAQTVDSFEKAEKNSNITLRSLRRVANAMGCRLEYRLVPNENKESL